jgi:drug/metabolite transporter (DMT)-like permease
LLAAIWGASFMFMRIGVAELGTFATAGLRTGIAALFLLPLALVQGQAAALQTHWRLTMAVGLLNSALPFVCFSYALLHISSGLSAILNATVPLFGAVVAWLWLQERLSGSRMVGLLIGFAGVAALAWDKANFLPDASGHGNASGWAVLACLLATVCYGIAASFTKRFLSGVPSLVSATGSQLGASVVLIPIALLHWPPHAISLKAWAAVVALGVLCTALAYVLYFRIIARVGPAKALTVTFAIPVFAVLYGVLLLGEEVSWWMLICGLVIVSGTALSSGLVVFRRH